MLCMLPTRNILSLVWYILAACILALLSYPVPLCSLFQREVYFDFAGAFTVPPCDNSLSHWQLSAANPSQASDNPGCCCHHPKRVFLREGFPEPQIP